MSADESVIDLKNKIAKLEAEQKEIRNWRMSLAEGNRRLRAIDKVISKIMRSRTLSAETKVEAIRVQQAKKQEILEVSR